MAETSWTVDALAAEWHVDRGYVWKLVNGEKPWSVERLLALPDDLEARFDRLRVESWGLIVIERVDHATAQRHLAIGLFNILAPTSALPAKATAMAKADLPLAARKAGSR